MNQPQKEDNYDAKWKEMSGVLKELEKKGLEIKECGFGQSRCEFVRGKNLEEVFKKNSEKLIEKINKIMGVSISLENKNNIQEIYKQFHSLNMIQKAIREEGDKKKNIRRLLPYEHLVKVYRCNCGRDHDSEERDHPKQYKPEEVLLFDPKMFYVLNISRSNSTLYFYLFLIIFLVLMYCLMPIWPYSVKLGVWWISYILLLLIIGIYLVRYIVFLFFYMFGYSIWLLPDISDEKLGFFESFKRVITTEKHDVKWYKILIRIAIFGTIGYCSFCVYRNPGLIDDSKKLILDALRDFYFFGEDKLVNSWNTTAIAMKHKTMSIDDLNEL